MQEQALDLSISNNSGELPEAFKCEKCSEKFRYRAMLDRHLWTHKNDNLDHICTKDRNKCFMEQLLQCDYCDKVIVCNKMSSHVRKIHFHESFNCVLCEKYDMTPEAYSKHVFDKHSGNEVPEPKRSCPKCDELDEIYKNRVGLKYHCDYCILVRPYNKRAKRMNLYSNQQYLFDCHLCGIVHETEELLKCHMRLHRAPKYICVQCHKIFVDKILFEEHCKKHLKNPTRRKINYANETNILKRKMMCCLNYFSSSEISTNLALIYNWIQMAINSIALTVILVSPMAMSKSIDEVFNLFAKVDARLTAIGIDCIKTGQNIKILICIFSYLIITITMGSYEFYVVIFHHRICSFFYWFLTFIPNTISSASLCCSYCILLFFLHRFKTIKEIINSELKNSSNFIPIIRFCSDQVIEQSIRSTMPLIFYLYNDIIDLSYAIEKFLGPIFLATFTSNFVITTTQIYHTYTIIMSTTGSEELGFSTWSAIVCINIVIVNLMSTVMLTSICESIENQSQECIRIVIKMRLNGSRYFTSEEIQKMTEAFLFLKNKITFSAIGFFKINYKMLCGVS
ncbi:hypothetical protein PVAND_014478 [Polypedilum vanderplanki]|uniref:Gustatory receptor n=1 Tax=Polypedilum vanderplanki TaxID=319348 RepID=A0A9J6B9R9_POLVA|nr:hypothetical protein PVAND_014478 [Polypedilum vanderplanki]